MTFGGLWSTTPIEPAPGIMPRSLVPHLRRPVEWLRRGREWPVWAAMSGSLIAYIYFTPALRESGMPVALIGITRIGAVLVLLIVVMRDLLRQATTLRTEMEGVI